MGTYPPRHTLPEPIGLSYHEEAHPHSSDLRSPYLPPYGKLCTEELYSFAFPS